MKAKGVIRDIVPWERSREYFFWRVRRRLAQDSLVKKITAADKALGHAGAIKMVKQWAGNTNWEDDKAVINFFEGASAELESNLVELRVAAAKKTVVSILAGLSDEVKADILGSL